jgi:hypothetical protein
MGSCCSKEDAAALQAARQPLEAEGGRRVGGEAPEGAAGASKRELMEAAARRNLQQQIARGGGRGGGTDLAEYRRKQELIGRAEALYADLREDPPFGLRAASEDALRRTIATLEARRTAGAAAAH